jgi:hypothetical protein
MREAQATQRRQQNSEAVRKAKVQRARECVTNVTNKARIKRKASVANGNMANASVANSNVANNDVANANVANTSTTYRYRNPEQRRTYQRDLMRKRRAQAKGA